MEREIKRAQPVIYRPLLFGGVFGTERLLLYTYCCSLEEDRVWTAADFWGIITAYCTLQLFNQTTTVHIFGRDYYNIADKTKALDVLCNFPTSQST